MTVGSRGLAVLSFVVAAGLASADDKTETQGFQTPRTSWGDYEYACHEGNLAMRNILSGARAAEAAAR
jgi:hypothetical protein